MSVTNFWEGEPRDDHGKWTSGGSSSSDKTQSIESLREKLEQETWPVMRSARGNYDAWFPPPSSVTFGHINRMATLLHSWSQADHWNNEDFRNYFLSQLHRQDLASKLRGSARALREAQTPQDQAAAGKDLSAQIRLYNPEHWVADLPILQQRADSALSPDSPPESLKAYGPVTEITNFEYAGRKAQLLRKPLPPGYEPIKKDAQGHPITPILAGKPAKAAAPPPPEPSEFVVADPEKFLQDHPHSIGSGQCVALVQAAAPVGRHDAWRPGAKVFGNPDIREGTIIATFKDGRYPDNRTGQHAAIYLSQDADGIWVVDQEKRRIQRKVTLSLIAKQEGCRMTPRHSRL